MTKLSMPLSIAVMIAVSGCAATPDTTSNEPTLTSLQQKASYAQGADYMRGLRKDGLGVDQAAFLLGVNDVLANREPRLPDTEISKAKDWLLVEQVKHQEATAAANLATSNAFLAENQRRQGITTLPSGLQYKTLVAGSGTEKPDTADIIEINYRLTKTDGTEIDSNLKRGKSALVAVKSLIPGVKEASQLMSKGAKWQLFIPPTLGYGENGTPDGKIAANETFVFDIELVGVNPPVAINQADKTNSSPQPKLNSSWR